MCFIPPKFGAWKVVAHSDRVGSFEKSLIVSSKWVDEFETIRKMFGIFYFAWMNNRPTWPGYVHLCKCIACSKGQKQIICLDPSDIPDIVKRAFLGTKSNLSSSLTYLRWTHLELKTEILRMCSLSVILITEHVAMSYFTLRLLPIIQCNNIKVNAAVLLQIVGWSDLFP